MGKILFNARREINGGLSFDLLDEVTRDIVETITLPLADEIIDWLEETALYEGITLDQHLTEMFINAIEEEYQKCIVDKAQ